MPWLRSGGVVAQIHSTHLCCVQGIYLSEYVILSLPLILRLFCFQFFPKYYVLTVHKLDGLFQNNKRFTEVELTATYASIYVTLKSKRVTVNVLF